MSAPVIEVWRDVLLRPRTRLAEHVRDEPRLVLLLFPALGGVMQSMFQGATNNMGTQGSVALILGFAIPIGCAWGLLQLHVLAGALWVVARRETGRFPFRSVRQIVALSMAPVATAFLAWLTAALLLGRVVFISPELWEPGSVSLSTSLLMTVLYFGSALCMVWSLYVLVLGVRELTGRSTAASLGTVALSLIPILAGAALVVFLAALVIIAV